MQPGSSGPYGLIDGLNVRVELGRRSNVRILVLIVFVESFHDTGNAHSVELLLEGLDIVANGIDVFESISEGVTMARPA